LAANEFYLVQDAASKKCSIVEAKPTISTMKVVGLVHKTKVEAETATRVASRCSQLESVPPTTNIQKLEYQMLIGRLCPTPDGRSALSLRRESEVLFL
jgi:hypothetical protein